MKLKKYDKNPVLSPNPKNAWESLVVCNPGVWYDEPTKTVYMLYRAAGNDSEHKIHFGLATSKDGYNFTRVSDKPVLSPSEDGYDGGCIEDARIVKMGDWFYVTYAFRPFPPGRYWEKAGYMPEMPYKNEPDLPRFTRENLTMSGLLISKDLKKFHRVGTLTTPDVDDRDVILFPEKVGGKFWVLRRPNDWVGPKYGCEKASIWISSGDDLLMCGTPELLAQSEQPWENKKIGGSCPPLKTDKGWLVCYHGVDKEKNTYRTGFLMLDLKDPRKVIARTEDYVMEPEHDYETKGIVPFGVVFPTGNVVINGTLFVYYGAADMYIGVATAPLKEVVDFVMKHPVKTAVKA